MVSQVRRIRNAERKLRRLADEAGDNIPVELAARLELALGSLPVLQAMLERVADAMNDCHAQLASLGDEND